MNIDLFKVSISIILAISGWLIGHWFTSNRARAIKRRELVTEYLVDVYRKLDRFTVSLISGVATEEVAKDINSAITDIQLFGSDKQIEYAIKIAEKMANHNSVPNQDLKDLIQDLRSDLRSELDLPEITKDVAHLNAQSSSAKNSNK